MKVKQFLALALCLLFALPLLPTAAAAATYETVEQTIRAMGILNGDHNGNLKLENEVTRAEFAKMMVCASIYKDSIGEGAGVSPFSDVKYDHWAAEYIRVAVTAGWFVGYVDGSFRPSNTITLEEAATALLRMLGYTDADLVGVYPTAHLAKYRSLGLDEGVMLERGQNVVRKDCLYLFYNLMSAPTKMGTYYGATLGYTVNMTGELDYATLVSAGTKGPYVIYDSGWTRDLPFDLGAAEIYRNGSLVEGGAIAIHDVYYYHENLRTLWLYASTSTGLYTAAIPSAAAPSSIVIGGNTFTIGTSNAAYKLSTSGGYAVGDTITVLLGRNGEIVEVLPGTVGQARYYGRIASIGAMSYEAASGNVTREILNLFCTDGVTREFAYDEGNFKEGDLIQVTIDQGETEIVRLPGASLTGTVNRTGTRIGDIDIAKDAEMIEVTNAAAIPLTAERIAGARLERKHVAFYALDGNGEISHLILRDVTGDYDTYGIVTSVSDVEMKVGDTFVNAVSIDLMVAGTENTAYLFNNLRYFPTGPAKIDLDGTTLKDVTVLTEVKITQVNGDTVTATNRQFTVARMCQVYVVENGRYTLTQYDLVSDPDKYDLKGYYESGYPAGGQIRILLATKR